jgi:predicted thioesterase
MQQIKPGIYGELTLTVTEQWTAASYGSGLVPAFATPAMIALIEGASVNAIRGYLDTGQTSVGVEVNVKHLAATPVGMKVRARAEVILANSNRVAFRVEVWDEIEKVGEGTHIRAIVDESRFLARMAQKRA